MESWQIWVAYFDQGLGALPRIFNIYFAFLKGHVSQQEVLQYDIKLKLLVMQAVLPSPQCMTSETLLTHSLSPPIFMV